MMGADRDLTDSEWVFLLAFFDRLSEAGISCPILRNYETLPQQIGNDLDVFISRKHLRKAEVLLADEVAKHDGVLIKKFKKDSFTAWWMRIGDAPLLHIDLFNGAFYWRGRCLENDDAVIDGVSKDTKGFTIPRPAHQAFSMYVTSLIWGGFYKAKYGATISKLLSDDSETDYYDQMMQRNFSAAGKAPFSYDENPDKKVALNYAQLMRECLRWRWFKKLRPVGIYTIARYWSWEVLNLWKPAGDWVLVSEEEQTNELIRSELIKTYGGAVSVSYHGKGLIQWLWFRAKQIQRRMARNELVLVCVDDRTVKSLINKPGCDARYMVVGDDLLNELVASGNYRKQDGMKSVGVKPSKNNTAV